MNLFQKEDIQIQQIPVDSVLFNFYELLNRYIVCYIRAAVCILALSNGQ